MALVPSSSADNATTRVAGMFLLVTTMYVNRLSQDCLFLDPPGVYETHGDLKIACN